MSPDKDDNGDLEHRLAVLGLAVSTCSPPTGSRPDTAELWDFMHDAVSDARREEILSHLAEDADLFSDWLTLRSTTLEVEETFAADAYESVSKAKVVSFSSLWRGLQGWVLYRPWITAGGVAALVALVVFSGLTQPPQKPGDFWQGWSQPISGQTDEPDSTLRNELDAVLVGVRSQLLTLSYAGTGPFQQVLPEHIPACPNDDDDCTTRRSALFELGSLAVDQLEQCKGRSSGRMQSSQQLQQIAEMVQTYPSLAALATPLNRWLRALEVDVAAACDAAAMVISGALPRD